MDPKIYLYLLMKLGMVMVASILSGLALGLWIDKTMHTHGLGVMGGIVLGVVGGFLFLFKEIGKISKLDDPQTDDEDTIESDTTKWPK
jgi:F0F1-type ATP synthase assembly protein I